jgi:hypothetical protein
MSDSASLAKVRLDEAYSVEFLRGRLGIGVALRHGLKLRAALSRLPLDAGEIWTWAFKSTQVKQGDLEGGLPQGITQEDHRRLLTQFLKGYLAMPGGFAILEDHDMTPSDELVGTHPPGSFLVSDELLYWHAANSEAVDSMLQFGLGLFNCIALSKLSPRWAGPPVGLKAQDFNVIAGLSDHIVVDAFDFEGFVVWSRLRFGPHR